MQTAYLLLGSNLGDSGEYLAGALADIATSVGEVVGVSGVYRTAPWGVTNQPDYLNQAVAVRTALPPHELLATVLGIEAALGRVRLERWGARVIDIDIILYGSFATHIDTPTLQIPHPRLHERRFALLPMLEVATALPDLVRIRSAEGSVGGGLSGELRSRISECSPATSPFRSLPL